jgi:cobalamin biosynthesis protein CobT
VKSGPGESTEEEEKMPSVDIFPIDSMQVFADLIHNQLGVKVRMRGDTIACDFNENPPVIYLPSLEFAKEEDVKALYGFALHEAGHVRYTKFRAIEEIRDYLLKSTHNYFEDEFIERRLRRDFPGGAEYLSFSNAKGYEIAVAGTGGRKLFHAPRESFLGNTAAIKDRLARQAIAIHAADLSKAGIDPNDPDLFKKIAERRDFVAAIADNVGHGLLRRCVSDITGKPLDEEDDAVFEGCNCPQAIADALFRGQLARVREEMERRGAIGGEDEAVVIGFLEKRLEITRMLWLWSYSWRSGPDKDLRRQFDEHPWKAALDEINAEPTRSTEHALEKAIAFCNKIGVKPVLPDDDRPVDAARKLVSEAEDKAVDADISRKELRLACRERDAVAREKVNECMELSSLLEAQDELASAEETARECSKRLAKARHKLKDARERLKKVRDRLAAERRALREARKEASDMRRQADAATDADEKAKLNAAAEIADRKVLRLSERCAADESLMARREEAVEFNEMHEHDALADSTSARVWLLETKNTKAEAEGKFEEAKKNITEQVKEAYKTTTAPLEATLAEKEKVQKDAEDVANSVLVPMRDHDAETEAPIAPGVLADVLREAIEKVRSTSIKDELGDVADTVKTDAPAAASAARMYQPFDRNADKVDDVMETPDGREDYEIARLEYKDVIDETTERLRKLYSPERNRIKVNVTDGRLDPRKAYKIGLAMKGVPQDLSRVWKAIQTRKDPRVAVSLLIDCSGSMAGPSIKLARAASCALSEVMRSLYIPHEIIGHTTHTGVKALGLVDPAECERVSKSFSRILPFQGYVFKRFEDNNPPASVFTDLKMNENLDGEAVMWALQRLGARRERTKICIAICDGLPNAAFSQVEELERHLFTVCKRAEAKEREGVHLCSIGIGVENVKQFYKNADVINEITELPKAVLTIVESVISKTGMA